MLKTVGVICEYNPFHLGHQKQFRQIRSRFGAEAAVVCVMSGNFVQRGEPAVFDKLARAAAAVDCGANLVLELPVTGALRSAEGFARCGVEILDRLGVEMLAFGSESGGTEDFQRLAAAMDTPEYTAALRLALADGQSYPAAREAAAKSLNLSGELLKTPNNILGLEYCRAALGRHIRPAALRREGDYHAAAADRENPSATAVRALAMDDTGRRVLRGMRELENIPVINAGQTPGNPDYFALELCAAGLYGLFGAGDVFSPPSQLRDERIYLGCI